MTVVLQGAARPSGVRAACGVGAGQDPPRCGCAWGGGSGGA